MHVMSSRVCRGPVIYRGSMPCVLFKHQGTERQGIVVRQPRGILTSAASGSAQGDGMGLEAAFQQELAARRAAQGAAEEAEAAAEFDGRALLALLQRKYGRSYDVSIVRRTYMGRLFVALNVMWKYKEQKSFGYTEEEFMQRLDYIARILVAWGSVNTVISQLTSTKERPRVGKAVSLMLEVPEEKVAEWLS